MQNATQKINRQWINTAILPPDNALGQLIALGPSLYVGASLIQVLVYN